MATDINLTSQEWCDIVFEEKNKAYGAYALRRSSSKRHLIALFAVLIVAIFLAFLPTLISTIKKATETTENINTTAELAKLKEMEEEMAKQEVLNQEPPPPPVRSTIQFTPPVITDADKMTDDKEMKSIDDLANTNTAVGTSNVKGEDNVDLPMPEVKHTEVAAVDDKPLEIVQQQPSFPGGEEAMMKYIRDKMRYPDVARETGIEGVVLIQFVVNRRGEIDDVKVMKSPSSYLSDEAVRVVKSMPKWIPGKQNGKEVSAYFRMPIFFKLQ